MSEVIICPVCGFSFRNSSFNTRKEKIKCPMCGYEFKNPNIPRFTPREFDPKF
jgi:uncharacterized protein (DUF2225 family)